MTALIRTLIGIASGAMLAGIGLLTTAFDRHGGASKQMHRRSFVRNAALGAVMVVLAEIGVGFARFFWPNKTGAFGGVLSVPASEVPAVNATPFRDIEGKFYLVHTKDGLLALYWRCTHLGCTVPWVEAEQDFHCPCHGSVYLYNGVRVAGPAPRPLDLMQTSVLPTGEVAVNTGKISHRSAYEPAQAVPYPA